MTNEQTKWAMEHDWCQYVTRNSTGKGVVVTDRYAEGGVVLEAVLTFWDYNKLKAWAGY